MAPRVNIVVVVCCIVVLLLQFILGSMINIFGATISFGIAAIVALSLCLKDKPHLVLCVVMGLIFDLTQAEPFGAYTLIFTVANVLLFELFKGNSHGSIGSNCIVAFVATFLFCLIDTIIVGCATPGVDFLSLLINGNVITIIVNSLISVALYYVFAQVIKGQEPSSWGVNLS